MSTDNIGNPHSFIAFSTVSNGLRTGGANEKPTMSALVYEFRYTENSIKDSITRFEPLFEFRGLINDWNLQVLALLQKALIDVLGSGFGQVDGRFILEVMEVSSGYETISTLIPWSTADHHSRVGDWWERFGECLSAC
jgi:hypothetical protein